MTNLEILNSVMNKWVSNIIIGMLPQIKIPNNNGFSKVISQIFGLDLSNYNILNEFSFLVPELVKNPINKYVSEFVGVMSLDDSQIPDFSENIINECINKCHTSGSPINIYGFEFSEKSFTNLKDMLKKQFNKMNSEHYDYDKRDEDSN